MTAADADHRARRASEAIRDDTCRAADQLAVNAIESADAALRKAGFSAEAKAARDTAYGAAGDAKASMYAEAERRHAVA